MDALSARRRTSAATRRSCIAANAYGRYFPLLTTAAGHGQAGQRADPRASAWPGLQAIGTARRLGRRRQGLRRPTRDARSRPRASAPSSSSSRPTIDATGAGGYARELTAEERAAQQAELNEVIGGMDVVITTAQVPGRKPPVLVTAEAVAKMKPGSVIVDMAASRARRQLSSCRKAGETVVTANGVTIIAPDNLPAIDAGRRVRVLRPQHLGAAARAWSRTAR